MLTSSPLWGNRDYWPAITGISLLCPRIFGNNQGNNESYTFKRSSFVIYICRTSQNSEDGLLLSDSLEELNTWQCVILFYLIIARSSIPQKSQMNWNGFLCRWTLRAIICPLDLIAILPRAHTFTHPGFRTRRRGHIRPAVIKDHLNKRMTMTMSKIAPLTIVWVLPLSWERPCLGLITVIDSYFK